MCNLAKAGYPGGGGGEPLHGNDRGAYVFSLRIGITGYGFTKVVDDGKPIFLPMKVSQKTKMLSHLLEYGLLLFKGQISPEPRPGGSPIGVNSHFATSIPRSFSYVSPGRNRVLYRNIFCHVITHCCSIKGACKLPIAGAHMGSYQSLGPISRQKCWFSAIVLDRYNIK